MNDDRIKNDILKSFKDECDYISRIDIPDYQTSAEFQTGMNKILSKAEKKPTRKEVMVLRPQYFRPDPSPKSGATFKKVMIAVAAVVCVVAARIFIKMNNKPQTIPPNDSVSVSDTSIGDPNTSAPNVSNSGSSNSDTNNSGVKLNQDITSAKCYKVDFQTVTEDQVAALFKAAPQKEKNKSGTRTNFTADGEEGSLGQSSGVGGQGIHYTVLYSTEQGDDYDSAVYNSYDYKKADADRDWDFLSRSEAEQKISDIVREFMPTGASVKAYAISAETYSELVKQKTEAEKEWNDKVQEDLGMTAKEKTWSAAADYYYFYIEQTVDGIPIQVELIGNMDNGTQTWGSEGSAVLSAEGLGYLRVFSPYKIIGEVETTEKFITFPEAEQMFKDKSASFLINEEIKLDYSRLVYVVLRAEDNELILTPAWEFKYNDEQFFRVNAYTGEEVVTV